MSDGGLGRFQKRIQAIPKAARRAVRPALVQGANEIAALQRALAPEDSGDLKASIAVTGPGQSTPPYSQPGGRIIVPELTAAITAGNTEVRYAHLVEYGSVRRSRVSPRPRRPATAPAPNNCACSVRSRRCASAPARPGPT